MERLIPSPGTTRTTLIILLSLILLGILIRIINFIGLCGYDDFAYAHIALEMADGGFHITEADPRYTWRFLVTFPTCIAFKVFGVRETTAVSFPLFCSIGNILIVWGLGKVLFNNQTGLLAAALVCVFPNSVVYSTMLSPEEVLSFFVGLSFLFFLLTETNSLRPSIGYLLCGFSIVLSYWARETGLFLIPILFLWSWQRRRISRAHIGLIIPLLLYVLIELSLSYYATGDFFYHYSQLRTSYEVQFAEQQQPYAWDTYIKGIFGGHLYGLAHFGFFYPAAVLSLIHLFRRKKINKVALPLLWMVTFFFYYQFGSTSLTNYLPIPKILRYLSVLTIPVLLIIAYTLLETKRQKYGRIIFTGILIFLITTSFIGMEKAAARHRYYFQAEGGKRKYQKIVEVLSSCHPQEVIVPDLVWKYRLSYYLASSQGSDTHLNLIVSEEPHGRLKEGTCLISEDPYIESKLSDLRVNTIFQEDKITFLCRSRKSEIR